MAQHMQSLYAMTDLTKLCEKAQDFRLPTLTRPELDALWTEAHRALVGGSEYRAAFRAVESLLCQAKRGNVCPDALPAFKSTAFAEGGGLAQGLADRLECLEGYQRDAS